MSDAAITMIVAGLLQIATMVVGFLTLWIKLKFGAEQAEEAKKKAERVEKKIDDNTTITRAGTTQASANAMLAANTAHEAKVATEQMAANMSKKLNGGIDGAIEAALKPLQDAMTDHALQDEMNMKEIRAALGELNKKTR